MSAQIAVTAGGRARHATTLSAASQLDNTYPRYELRVLRPRARTRGGLSPRSRLEQVLDLRVEIPRDDESGLTPVRRDDARHRVVGQMHAIGALVNEDRHRCVQRGVWNGLRHFLHDERI